MSELYNILNQCVVFSAHDHCAEGALEEATAKFSLSEVMAATNELKQLRADLAETKAHNAVMREALDIAAKIITIAIMDEGAPNIYKVDVPESWNFTKNVERDGEGYVIGMWVVEECKEILENYRLR